MSGFVGKGQGIRLGAGSARFAAVRRAIAVLAAVFAGLALAACAQNGAIVVAQVTYTNDSAVPSAHDPTDDVCYVRLIDADGAGAVLWSNEASPKDASMLDWQTTSLGEHVAAYAVPLSDAVLATATMPLRMDAYLYDAAVGAPPIAPAGDAERFTDYAAPAAGQSWSTSFSIASGEVKPVDLTLTIPFP